VNPIYGLIGRLSTVPALLAAQGAGSLQASLRYALAHSDMKAETKKHLANVAMSYGADYYDESDADCPYAIYRGIAIIPIQGTLVNRCGWACSWVTGYDYVQMAVLDAMQNPQVKAIAFDVDSCGGEAQGCFETADLIKSMRGKKPMTSFVNANALSGGYMLACAADKIVLTPTGNTGSIGVVIMHVDYSKMLQEEGIAITFIYAGDHKKDGNPYEALPPEVKANLQAQVDRFYEMFTSTVASNLGLTVEAVKATQAQVYDASESLSLGLIHAVEAAPSALAAFCNELSGSSSSEITMGTKENAAEATAESATTVAVAAVTAPAVAAPAAVAATTVDAAGAERARIQGITGSEEAKDRTALANHLAFNTTMGVDEAKALMAVAPLAAKNDGNAFAAAMNGTENPKVGADDQASAAGQSAVAVDASRILSAHSMATGVKH
jgi:signal peptide peptidase SppA